MHFICPLCQQSLSLNAQGLTCVNRHHFDRAREGYFNLLPAHHKNSLEPGDAKQQLLARRKFLAAGFFAPLLPVLYRHIPASTRTLLDIGCGEGYFTEALRQQMATPGFVYGIDIAKTGVKLAARTYSGNYAVASSFALPLADRSMDIITRIYAPSCDAELQRVLAPQGRVIIVTPGDYHLLALRNLIYTQVRPHPQPKNPASMRLVATEQVCFPLVVPAGELTQALLQMTPFLWHLSPALQQELMNEGIVDQADFNLNVYTPDQ